MGKTKESLVSDAVSDQQSLVQLMLAQNVREPIKHTIPGGKFLFTKGHEMTIKELESAVYTWLRRVHYFDEVTINFSSKPTEYNTKALKVADFPVMNVPIWVVPTKGKSFLAKALAAEIAKGGLVSITAKPDGLYACKVPVDQFGPGSEDWLPSLSFLKSHVEEYRV